MYSTARKVSQDRETISTFGVHPTRAETIEVWSKTTNELARLSGPLRISSSAPKPRPLGTTTQTSRKSLKPQPALHNNLINENNQLKHNRGSQTSELSKGIAELASGPRLTDSKGKESEGRIETSDKEKQRTGRSRGSPSENQFTLSKVQCGGGRLGKGSSEPVDTA